MKIEVGEFARTTDGIIGIIENYDNGEYWIRHSDIDIWKCSEDYIVKHSKNIIDLIEVGDLVNGYKVLAIADSIYENSKRILIYRDTRKEKWIYIQEYDGKLHTQDDIVEILTHEQYQANCYTVERKK